jgi:allantoate deiminase
MDDGLVAEAESLARERGLRFRRMASGAGHDAMIFAGAGVPSLMLFVPSRGGVSHSPDELTSPEQLAAGIGFARELLPRVAARAAGAKA